MMEEHVSEMSNMTCVLREMNVLNSRNNIDIAAMKADTENYNVSVQLLYVGMWSMLCCADAQPVVQAEVLLHPGQLLRGR